MSPEQYAIPVLFVIPCLVVIAIFLVIMLATGEEDAPPAKPKTDEDLIRELKKRLVLERG